MDYSVPSDSDQLAGPSPWDSPKANRTSFPSSTHDIPPSPALPSAQSPYPDSQGSPSAPRYHNGSANAPQQPATPTVEEPPTPDSPPQKQSVQSRGTDHAGEQSAYQQNQYGPQQSQQRSGALRYQAARQQRPVPQYKLQAKITALERIGRKDPVLRFDVYVCILPLCEYLPIDISA